MDRAVHKITASSFSLSIYLSIYLSISHSNTFPLSPSYLPCHFLFLFVSLFLTHFSFVFLSHLLLSRDELSPLQFSNTPPAPFYLAYSLSFFCFFFLFLCNYAIATKLSPFSFNMPPSPFSFSSLFLTAKLSPFSFICPLFSLFFLPLTPSNPSLFFYTFSKLFSFSFNMPPSFLFSS
ncbi:unnamed protein product [Acanthosepion pharaonis]|uniref:Uncharacterized protein n=1 Tax=Acanthosepion pharaonis TaxID=158019 RepID=A0A812B477_ACAPH|nr:unnamed protein product [Sepia pharaonis]